MRVEGTGLSVPANLIKLRESATETILTLRSKVILSERSALPAGRQESNGHKSTFDKSTNVRLLRVTLLRKAKREK